MTCPKRCSSELHHFAETAVCAPSIWQHNCHSNSASELLFLAPLAVRVPRTPAVITPVFLPTARTVVVTCVLLSGQLGALQLWEA
jgi:hypothetical protein